MFRSQLHVRARLWWLLGSRKFTFRRQLTWKLPRDYPPGLPLMKDRSAKTIGYDAHRDSLSLTWIPIVTSSSIASDAQTAINMSLTVGLREELRLQ